jgi:hypothetical protein
MRHFPNTLLVAYCRFLFVVAAAPLLGAAPVLAQETAPAAQEAEAADLAKQVQNPLASLVTLPFQANFNGGVGEFDRQVTNLNFQPVIPFPGKKWNIVARAIIPYLSLPIGEAAAETGFGDLSLTLFASPADAGSVVWGAGPAFLLPTASNPELLGSGKFSLGPSAVLFAGAGKFTFGGVVNNVWSIAGDSERESVNQFFGQYFLNFNFGKGWAIGTAPIITCDWKAPSGDQCTIPWGAQISKVLRFGSRPVNLLAGYYKNSEHPEGGAEEQVRMQINLLFPQTGN